jgi:hypothetical protein
MIESPLLQELLAETKRETMKQTLLRLLAARFGSVPQDITAALQAIPDRPQLEELIDWAARCPDLEAFRTRLTPQACPLNRSNRERLTSHACGRPIEPVVAVGSWYVL